VLPVAGQEILSLRRSPEEKVVIQVEEVVGKAGNRMRKALDGGRVEGREIGLEAGKLVVVDDMDTWMI
jgi:hypothetical protein